MESASEIEFRAARVDAGPGGELAQAMREETAAMYDGLELDGPSMPRAGAEELSPPGGAFIVGWRDGEPVCCGGIKRLSEGTCEIKKMYVVPAARGQGVARTLLHELEREAMGLLIGRRPARHGPQAGPCPGVVCRRGLRGLRGLQRQSGGGVLGGEAATARRAVEWS